MEELFARHPWAILQPMNYRKTAIVVIWTFLAMSGQVFALATVCPMENMALHMNDVGHMDMHDANMSHAMTGHGVSEASSPSGEVMANQPEMDCLCDQLCSYCVYCVTIPQSSEGMFSLSDNSLLLSARPQFLPPFPPDSLYRPPITA